MRVMFLSYLHFKTAHKMSHYLLPAHINSLLIIQMIHVVADMMKHSVGSNSLTIHSSQHVIDQ